MIAFLVATSALADDTPENGFQSADKALNATFGEIRKRLSGDQNGMAKLVQAQRAWIAFRDGECRFQSSAVDGGSIAPTIATICRTELTNERTRQLQHYLQCEEGDLSCPVPREPLQ